MSRTWALPMSSCCRSPSIRSTARGAISRPACSRRPAGSARRRISRLRRRLPRAGIGVLLDWVPGHFPDDPHGLARFDGTALYEHADPRQGLHLDWGTLIYNYGRREVAQFPARQCAVLAGRFDVDGLRVDAVASMLYLDYSRPSGDWIPNAWRPRESRSHRFPAPPQTSCSAQHAGRDDDRRGIDGLAEVSRAVEYRRPRLRLQMEHGLDARHPATTCGKDPIHRSYHHDELTFGLLYAFTENFILPLSHDEVVHGKALAARQDARRRLAAVRQSARLLRLHVRPSRQEAVVHGLRIRPGARVESRSFARLAPAGSIRPYAACRTLVRDLNRVYRETPALHELDCEGYGFEWIDCHDVQQSIISYLARNGSAHERFDRDPEFHAGTLETVTASAFLQVGTLP